jgi:hypothetical protein
MQEEENRSPFIIVYILCALSGAFMGFLLGLLF